MRLARRSLLAAASLAAAPRPAWAQNLSRGVFTHGVASGDPLSDGVILWTRFAHSGDGRIGWEIAEDDAFDNPVLRGSATSSLADDFCVKVDARGLAPGRRYFYRFLSASGPSLTGQTRTAPADHTESLTVALFSCANYAYGYFHAYGHAAQRDEIDLVLHAGDYIYEYGRGTYPSADEAIASRALEPVTETVRLADYYQRYALYHADPDLQELRRLKPMSAVWDDHEIANDTWREGAQNHFADFEGTWADRVAAASKAYFDWMPIRRPQATGARIYRYLDWGNLARIVLLDTRLVGRDAPLDWRNALAGDPADLAAALAEFRRTTLDAPGRSLLGAAQETWLGATLAQSKQRGQPWQILTQQVVVGDQAFPAGMSRLLPDGTHANTRRWVSSGEALGQLGQSWNLDAWAGFPAARARLLEQCVANANNAIVLGGDSHNCWLNNLPSATGARLAAIEFAGGSVSSPGFERTFAGAGVGERETRMRAGNENLAFCDLTNRGYGVLRFTPTSCAAEWNAFRSVRSPIADEPRVTRINSSASLSAGPGAWSV